MTSYDLPTDCTILVSWLHENTVKETIINNVISMCPFCDASKLLYHILIASNNTVDLPQM